jgi:hypothetical protein
MRAERMRSFFYTTAFVAVMFLTSVGFAQQGGAPAGGGASGQPDVVGEMDKNNDGNVVKSEWTGDPKAFAKYDENNDGSMAKDERLTGLPTLDLHDRNGELVNE